MKTVLILAANPTDRSRLRLDQEVREIEEGLQRASKGQQFRLVQKWAVRSRDFYRAILEHQPQIVHFCGHGAGVDGIVLEDDTGQPTLVDKEALSKLFKLFAVKGGVECVVLNACYSEVQAEAISQYIKYVIGMNQAIGDKAAIAFAVAFYDALGAGRTVEFAFDLGCSQLIGLKEDQTPVLNTTSIHPADIQFEAGDIPPNPYLGLSAFGEKDAAFFFGREKFTEELFHTVYQQPLVAVIGASGSGKSSVVFAGLIPRLREQGIWLIESLRPKSQPFDELAIALVRQLEPNVDGVEKVIKVGKLTESLKKGEVTLHQVASQILENKPNKRFLLVVDQFEELYTQCQDKEEQQNFIDTLLSAVQQKSITLVFTLRADFYGYVLSYRPFSDALQQFLHKPLGLMSREELKTAIEQPAQKLNVELQTHLAERILDDVGNEPGNLPLLEFALTQLWDNQKDGELTHKAYDKIGGVKQALVKHAEQVYSRLSEAEKYQAQRVFLALVQLGETTEATRRVATISDVGRQNWNLVTYLAGSEVRLVVTGLDNKSSQETVEVVHEALIREWKRLREWIENNRQKLIQQRKIESEAQSWQENNRARDYLLIGTKLAQAEDFWQTYGEEISLSSLAQELIAASKTERERLKREAEERQKQELEAAQKLAQESEAKRKASIMGARIAIGSTMVVGAVAIFAFAQWREAQIQSDVAQLEALNSIAIASNASNLDLNALVNNLKAGKQLQKFEWSPKVDVNTKMGVLADLNQITYQVREQNRLIQHDSAVLGVAYSPDGKTLASASWDKTVKLWRTDGSLITTLKGHKDAVFGVAYSPDGKTLASASWDKTVKLWRTDGSLITTLKGHKDAVFGVAYSPDGKTLASAGEDKTVKLWRTDGSLIITLKGHEDAVIGVAYSPDGKTLASASRDKTVKLWRTDGSLITTLKGHEDEVFGVAYSPDGKTLASASRDKTVKLWRTDGSLITTFKGHEDAVNGVAYSPDGKTLASASRDKTVKLWRTDGSLITTLKGHEDLVIGVAYSPDGKTLASASSDKTMKLWRTDGSLITTLKGHEDLVFGVAYSPDGKTLASASRDKTVKLWRTDGSLIITLKGHKDAVNSIVYNPDGKTLASASDDKTVRLWRTDGSLITTLKGHEDVVNGVAYSPGGKTLASASDDKTVKLWRTDGSLITTLKGHKDLVIAVAYSPNGKTLASASYDKTVKLWRTDGSLITTLKGHEDAVFGVAYSPDGKKLASASRDKTVKLWRTDGSLITTLKGHEDKVNGVAYNPDSKTFVSVSDDKTVKLWRTDGSLITTLKGHDSAVWGVAYNPDGKTLASASLDKTVKLWTLNFNLNDLLNRGCTWLHDYLHNPNNGMKPDDRDRHICDDVDAN
ncbi:AAA family ATPase [Aetokthonos hydrillicola]|uniref:nSTAND1 domain-containing NTPase n=1 Tax=Aetokthonos hydrillicola TaxID=1550245 RepID=UPI002877AF58|nr:AAA family ATPase [Aetokthonos hydrillicola]